MLKHIEKIGKHGQSIYCIVDERGMEQGPFEEKSGGLTTKGYYKDGKMDGPINLRSTDGTVNKDYVYRDGMALSGQEAEDYLQVWKKKRAAENEQRREQERLQPGVTLLTEEQIWGDENGDGQLEVIKKYGTAATLTDLAILLGGSMTTKGTRDGRTSEGDLGCSYYTTSPYEGDHAVCTVSIDGAKNACIPSTYYDSVRPVLPPVDTANLLSMSQRKGINDVDIVEYGSYPQTVADKETADKLEAALKEEKLSTTGKTYMFDSGIFEEYQYGNKKYVCVTGDPGDKTNQLSSGEIAEKKPYWVRVEPIEWLVDKSGFWVAKKALLSGITFSYHRKYDGDFSKTNMRKYLNNHFAKEMAPSEKDIKRAKMLKGLSEKLAEFSDLEQVKKTITPASTPERTETLARIVRIRREKAILSAAAQRAHKEGDEKAIQEIVKMAKPYAAREAAIRNKFRLKRAERRGKKGRE